MLYEVRNPTPLASAPARVLDFDAAQIMLYTSEPGAIVVRVATPAISRSLRIRSSRSPVVFVRTLRM